MSKTATSVIVTTLVVIAYTIISTLPVNFSLVFSAMIASQGLLIWMVITILKDTRTSTRTFDEYFYEDANIKPGSK
jgi:hypothetical protein